MTLTASTKNATLITINVDWIPTALIGQTAARIHHAVMGRVTVIMTLNVMVYCCVAAITVKVDHQKWIAVKGHAIMTQTALTRNATLMPISVVLIPTALIGPSVAKIHPVVLGRVIVIFILIVKED